MSYRAATSIYKSTEFKILEPARVARNANFRPLLTSLVYSLDQDFRPRSGSKTQDFRGTFVVKQVGVFAGRFHRECAALGQRVSSFHI